MTHARFHTMRHLETVRNFLNACVRELLLRGEQHDQSKLEPPEVDAYETITHQLRVRGLPYGSDEYRAVLRGQQAAIAHHYAHNRHHPEHHAHGVSDMTLIDLLELLCDWKSSSLRQADGDIYKSLEMKHQQLGYSYELASILKNTVDWLETQHVFHKAHES